MKTQSSRAILVLSLALCLNGGCSFFNTFSLPFGADEVSRVELIRLEHPMLGGVLQRDTLAAGEVQQFMNALDGSTHRGITKVWTPLLIRFTLRNESTFELKATETIFSNRQNSDFYGFDGGSMVLTRFFPTFFEVPMTPE